MKINKNTLWTALALAVVWLVLGILQTRLEPNRPMQILNFLTFAQGGLYGGIVGAVGGLLGKAVVAACASALVAALVQKKNPFTGLGDGCKELVQAFKAGKPALAGQLKGVGAGLLLYAVFNLTQSWENSMVGIVGALMALLAAGRKEGFLWRKLGGTILVAMAVGFALGVLCSLLGFVWGGAVGLAALVAGIILGRTNRQEVAASVLLAVFFLAGQPSVQARDKGWVLVGTDVKASTTSIHNEDVRTYDSWITDITNLKTSDYGFSFDAVTVHTKESSGAKDTRQGRFESTFVPFESSYRPGDPFSGRHSWKKEGNFDAKIKVVGVLDYNNGQADENKLGPSAETEGFAYVRFTFPEKEKVNGDILTVRYKASIFDESILFIYTFQWNGKGGAAAKAEKPEKKTRKPEKKAEMEDDDLEIEGGGGGLLNTLLGTDGEHASDVLTVALGLVGAAGADLGGSLGGVVGAAAGGAVPPVPEIPVPEAPEPMPEPMPEPKPEPEPELEPEPKRHPHFCPQCGTPCSENAKFCRACGHKLI